MEMLIYRLGILMLGFSFGLFALFSQVPVSAQQQLPPPPVASPPPPLLSPLPPSPVIQSPPPPLVTPPSWTLSPPPTLIWTAPHHLPKIPRNHPPSKREFKRHPPPKKHKLNSGEKVGLIFIVIAGVLQFFVAGSLIFLRRQILRVKDRYENVE